MNMLQLSCGCSVFQDGTRAFCTRCAEERREKIIKLVEEAVEVVYYANCHCRVTTDTLGMETDKARQEGARAVLAEVRKRLEKEEA